MFKTSIVIKKGRTKGSSNHKNKRNSVSKLTQKVDPQYSSRAVDIILSLSPLSVRVNRGDARCGQQIDVITDRDS